MTHNLTDSRNTENSLDADQAMGKHSADNSSLHFNKLLGNKLRTRRKELGLALEKVAGKVGVTYQQIQKYEGGLSAISVNMLYRICDVLGLKPSQLLIELESETAPDTEETKSKAAGDKIAAYLTQIDNNNIAKKTEQLLQTLANLRQK